MHIAVLLFKLLFSFNINNLNKVLTKKPNLNRVNDRFHDQKKHKQLSTIR